MVWVLCAELNGSGDDAEDVRFVDDEDVFAVELHFGAAVLGDEHLVADLHGEKRADILAFVILAGAEGENFSFLGFLFCGVGQEDAASGFFFAGGALHEDATTER